MFKSKLKDVKSGSKEIKNKMESFNEFKKKEVKGNSLEKNLDKIKKEEKEIRINEMQDKADVAAKKYNSKFKPYERGLKKGLENIEKTKNDGVSFAKSDYIYKDADGNKCIAKIEATGSRVKDFDEANKQVGLKETPEDYVWHHVDDYNVKDGTITLELVEVDAHNKTKPHSGGCAQFDAVNGKNYN